MNNRIVFLTGATGNGGQYVLAEFMRRGMSVTALVRKPLTLDGCRIVVGDLAALEGLAGEISGADAIVHVASPRSLEQELALRDVLGMGSLLSLWRKGPFIYVSSPALCAIPPGKVTENGLVDPENWYQSTKIANEFQLRMVSDKNGRGPGISLRPGTIFSAGPRRNNRQDLSLIFQACRAGWKFVFDSEEGLESYGTSFTGGEDFGRAVADALTIKTSGAYNVASGDFRYRDLILLINRLAGTKADFIIRPDTRPQTGEFRVHQSRFFLDTTAFRKATGWQPRQTLEELVEAFVRAERDAGAAKGASA